VIGSQEERQIKRTALLTTLTLLLISILTSTSYFKIARASTTIYIRADGSINPETAPIQKNGDIYTLTGNINSDFDGIVIERDSIILDGAGYTLQGTKSPSSIGIYMSENSNVTIRDLNIKTFESGILLDAFSSHNEISGNKVEDNDYGISCWGYSDSNKISGNNITANYLVGIWIVGSSGNSVSENNIAGNSQYGISLESSSNNSVCHNNFTENADQIYIYDSTNFWDDGYPSGGNFWSDHVGTDNYRGSSQNEAGSDGICDTSYPIDADNKDYYPLTKPYGGPHDIGITNITTSKTIIGQSYSSTISIKIINYGINAETFSITTYANMTVINQKQMTLTSRNSSTLTFSWNTTGFTKANYTLTAYAWPVPNEIETSDNTKAAKSTIKVGVPGDLNNDGKCNLSDLIKVASKFGTQKGDPRYDPNYDMNNDDKINLSDMIKVASHFGTADP
jgi:parallel beta-helix repeat protein